MALLRWLFGRDKSNVGTSSAALDRWAVSESGNAMLVTGPTRITVFRHDHGWKFCIADVDDQEDPFFSHAYSSEREAREEALAHFRGEPSRHQTLSASVAEECRQRWEEHIRERSRLIDELQRSVAENPDLGITALRKPEAKISSHLKQIEWQIDEYRSAGVSTELMSLAEVQKSALANLANEVSARISAKQALRPPQKKPVSDSQLSNDLAKKVNDLIQLFEQTPVIGPDNAERQFRAAMQDVTAKMFEGGITYGEASGTPDFLNQDEASFRSFMKKADQDLRWQCDTVADAFRCYLETGETPAPHYPMRVAVLLRKAKDFDRERRFLGAWCNHFPSGNGAQYTKLVERAKKAGAISA